MVISMNKEDTTGINSINNSELRLMELIWESEPVNSGRLVTLANEAYGWKKSTVYTIVKKLLQKGVVESENAVIRSTVDRARVLSEKSETVIEKSYNGSLPMFLSAFLSKEKLTAAEAEELKRLIDSYTEE